MDDLREKLIMKSATECTLCNEALVACFEESDSDRMEFSRELSQAIKIQAGVELFSPNAIYCRLKNHLDPVVADTTSAIDGFNGLNKSAKAKKAVNEAVKLGKAMAKSESTYSDTFDVVTSENKEDVQAIIDASMGDTVTGMLVNTELDDRLSNAIKQIDELLNGWVVTGKKFYLDSENLIMNLERLKRKVQDNVIKE